jgi:CspA family cold shock protein
MTRPHPTDDGALDRGPARKGTVKRLLMDKGFGFLADPNGVEYFFHSSACTFDFEQLQVGDALTFVPSSGPKGPRAEAVERV